MVKRTPDHYIIDLIADRVLARIDKAKAERQTYERIAEKCGTVKNHIYDLHKRKKRLTLSMAFRCWEGLGGKLSDLLVDLGPDPFWEKILAMVKEDRELVVKLVDLLEDQQRGAGIKSLKHLIDGLHEEKFGNTTPSCKKPSLTS